MKVDDVFSVPTGERVGITSDWHQVLDDGVTIAVYYDFQYTAVATDRFKVIGWRMARLYECVQPPGPTGHTSIWLVGADDVSVLDWPMKVDACETVT